MNEWVEIRKTNKQRNKETFNGPCAIGDDVRSPSQLKHMPIPANQLQIMLFNKNNLFSIAPLQLAIMFAARSFALNTAPASPAGLAARASISKITTIKG